MDLVVLGSYMAPVRFQEDMVEQQKAAEQLDYNYNFDLNDN